LRQRHAAQFFQLRQEIGAFALVMDYDAAASCVRAHRPDLGPSGNPIYKQRTERGILQAGYANSNPARYVMNNRKFHFVGEKRH